MDIYIQIKNKKGEVFRVFNLGREEYLFLFKEHLKKLKINNDILPIFFNKFKPGNYVDVQQIKKLKEEVKVIAGTIGKNIENYKEFIRKRTDLENEIINCSSLKNLIAIGGRRLEEISEGEESDIKTEIESINKEVAKLSERERQLESERKKFQAVFDVELLFDILSESIKYSSGIYIKN